ncbi:MAG: T9SS type A sorting domain-containing protein [Bacteroidetes bacterium]|jgi:hypothetical protein|nr:T9SS type A sorting domain-containing protein [Bacteroidota bacterium]
MKLILSTLLLFLFQFSIIAQCDFYDIGISTSNFSCQNKYGEVCFSINLDLVDFNDCDDQILEVTFPRGSFLYTSLGEFEVVSNSTDDEVILQLDPIPAITHAVITVCFEGLVQTPGTTMDYSIYDPQDPSQIVNDGTIILEPAITIGSPNTTTLVSDAINNGDLLPPFNALTIPQRVRIEGTLKIDQDYAFSSPFDGQNSSLQMGHDAEIVVEPNKELILNRAQIYSCTKWKGIDLSEPSTLKSYANTIKNAEVAVELKDQTVLFSNGNVFKYNDISIASFGSQYKDIELNLINGLSYTRNKFTDGNRAIHLENTSPFIASYPSTNIESMNEVGIYLLNTSADLSEIIIKDSGDAGIVSNNPKSLGIFVNLIESDIVDCDYGMLLNDYHFSEIGTSKIEDCSVGILAFDGLNATTDIHNNTFDNNATALLNFCNANTTGTIFDNEFTQNKNEALLFGNGGKNKWATQYNFFDTHQTLSSSTATITYNNMNSGRIFKNNILSRNKSAISVTGGTFNTVVRNILFEEEDNSSELGISIKNSDLNLIKCNDIYDYQRGLDIRGNCAGTDVIGNGLYADNGLQYGMPSQGFANTGEQIRKGNKFLLSAESDPKAYNYSMADVARNNRYIVASNNTQGNAYYPYFVTSIDDWFLPNGWGDFQCPSGILGPQTRFEDYLSAFESNDDILDTISYEYGSDVAFGVALKQYLYGQRLDSVYQLDEYQAFTDSTEYEDALLLGDVIYDFEQLLESVAISDSVYEVWSSNFETHLHDLRELFVMDSTTTIDSSIYNSAVYASLKDSISTMQDDMAFLLQSSQEVLDNDLPILQSSLQSLTNLETDAAAYTKDIYLIAMDFLKSSFVDFTSAQKNTIRNISEHCMYKYESSVALARSLRVRFDTLIDYSAFDNACSDNEVNLRGTENEPKIGSLTVSPNPAVNEIQVTRMHGEEREEYRIYNTQGVLVDQFIIAEKVQRHQLFIGHLPSGMYWIKSNSQNRQSHATFIKS